METTMFSLLPILFGLFFLVVLIAMIVHMVAFGTVFGLIFKGVSTAIDKQRELQESQEPKACAYCGAAFPAAVKDCPNCGGKR